MKKRTLSAVCLFVSAAMLASGCSSDGEVKEELTEKVFQANGTYVKMLGRTYNDEEGVLWLANSASGAEFTVTGTECSVTVVGDSMTGSDGSQARFAVYADGERVVDELITEKEMTFDIFSCEEAKTVTVQLIKLSEAAQSTIGIKEINVTSIGDIAPTEDKELKIEFIGDSITCGYGVDDEDRSHHFSTSTEDATKAYAYKTAQLLGADYSLFSYSGWGIISGYTSKGVMVSAQQLPAIYGQLGYSYGSTSDGFNVSQVDWDFSQFVPDIIVINLGTNDASYTGGEEEYIQQYTDAYAEFLKTVRSKNADAHIICSLGIMGDELYDAVCAAAEAYTEETGDENISVFHFDPQDGTTGYAADWHPTEATHELAAQALAEYISTLIS